MLWPFGVYALAAAGIAAGMIALSHVLGERHREATTTDPYESGIEVTGSARARFSIRFYLVAVFFVIFDLEVAVIVAWAVVAREVGWRGYAELATFVGVLLIALLYLWRNGGLDWGNEPQRRPVGGSA